MRRVLSGGLLSALVAFGLTSGAGAQEVQRSGNVYHKNVCKRVVGPAATCHAHIVVDAAGNAKFNAQVPVGGFGPSDLRDAYKVSATGSSATVIAIVDAFGYDNAEVDLATYRSFFGLPECSTANGCFKKLNQKGKQKDYPAQNVGWAQESALDVDMASAMCPNCQIWLVEADDNSFKNLAKAVNKAAELGAHVISNSYGAGEFKGAFKLDGTYTHPGVAITASSGDGGFEVQYPASSPHVISVGGTHLIHAANDRGWTETAWSGAGSGCSKVFDKPVWQLDAKCKKRMVADVSAVSDPATGVAVYGPHGNGVSGWLIFGGTSVAAPLIGGIYGANGGVVVDGSNPYAHTADIFDIVGGSNGTCKAGKSYYCTAVAGYDGPTGLGTPNGSAAFGD